MKRNKIITLLLIFFVIFIKNGVTSNINPNLSDKPEKIRDVCKLVQNLSPPLQDIPNQKKTQLIKDCDAISLYYGFENVPNYTLAKECAFINNDYAVLAMIYANGVGGVKPDANIALHYVCLLDGAVAELEGWIGFLEKMNKHSLSFDICNFAASPDLTTWCTEISNTRLKSKQANYLISFKSKLNVVEVKMLEKLKKTGNFYIDTRVDNEFEHSGYTAMNKSYEEGVLRNKMMNLFHKIEQCRVRSYTNQEYQKADLRLNSLYKKIQNNPRPEYSRITKDNVKKTERAWLKYRDAGVAFGLSRCPQISKEDWLTLITKERIEQLGEMSGS